MIPFLSSRAIWRSTLVRAGEKAKTSSANPVMIVQHALANPSPTGLAPLIDAFDEVVRDELWRQAKSVNGMPFETFGAFATADFPHGLGIRSEGAAVLARCALLKCEHYEAWTEILERVVRTPGRPKKRTIDDNLRFYPISRARTSTDRLLLSLKKDAPEYFERVGELSPYRAAVDAGLVHPPRKENKLRFGVYSVEGLKQLKPKVQAQLAREIFRAVDLSAQADLIANELMVLGPELAQRWRDSRGGF